MKVELVQQVSHYIPCPFCGDQSSFSITHLLGENTTFGPWYCDKCGHSIRGEVKSGSVEIEKRTEVKINTLDLLCIPPHEKPVYFVVAGSKISPRDSGDEELGHTKFFYEEHTCPTNWLGEVLEVVDRGDRDPHGLFKYNGSIDRGRASDDDEAERLLKHFNLIEED